VDERGAKIIDFNVRCPPGNGMGEASSLPAPRLDVEDVPSQGDLVDRDLYAWG